MSRESKTSSQEFLTSGYSRVCIVHMLINLFLKAKAKPPKTQFPLKQNCYIPILLKCSFPFIFGNQLHSNDSNSFLCLTHIQFAFKPLRALTEETTTYTDNYSVAC